MAQKNAEVERAQAERHEQEAQLHERGMADDKLIDDHERDRFDGVASTDRDRDDNVDDRAGVRDGTTGDTSDRANTEYEQGREDERVERR